LEATSALLSGNNICIVARDRAHANAFSFRHITRLIVVTCAARSWNKGTQIWLALYVGKRLPAKMGAQVEAVARLTPHVTPHTSHVTHHTSHITCHTSHLHSHITAVQESHCDGHQCPVARLVSRCVHAQGVVAVWHAARLTLRRLLLHFPPGRLLERGGEEAFCSRCPFFEGVLLCTSEFSI